jgi:SEC-C motif domain protein
MTTCPCGTGREYEGCCGPILAGAPAPTAEALMRSRYTAYVKGDVDHILGTYTAEAGKGVDRETTETWSKESTWLGLEILGTEGGGADDRTGHVHFVAHFKQGDGPEQRHEERASFVRSAKDGRWRYAEGKVAGPPPVRREATPGRNDPCTCGSGKKWKKCHGA